MLMQHNLHLLGMVAASILAVAPTDAFAQAKAGEQGSPDKPRGLGI